MRIVLLSDTHCAHRQLKVPQGDMIIHAGDFTHTGKEEEVESFFKWFVALPHRHKIVVPGNHEITMCNKIKRNLVRMDRARYNYGLKPTIKRSLDKIDRARRVVEDYSDRGVHFLIDRAVVVDGIKIYGSPWCVGNYNIMGTWGFWTDNPKEHWVDIPPDTDILVTHTPPSGILDDGLGCKALLNRVKVVKPYLHVFGHIHSKGGEQFFTDKTHFINAAVMNDKYNVVNPSCVVHTL